MSLEGFLNKQEEHNAEQKKKRWFQIDSVQKRIYSYKNKEKEELLGFMNLSDGIVINEYYFLLSNLESFLIIILTFYLVVEIDSFEDDTTSLLFNVCTY